MKLRLLQNIAMAGAITAFGFFSFNTMATFAQAPLEEKGNPAPNLPGMPMNQNMRQMMENMTSENCCSYAHKNDDQFTGNNESERAE